MRAVVVSEPGGIKAFEFKEIAEPTPGSGELLVRVTAAGLNFIDVYQRSGLYARPRPYVAGVEGVGTVTALGDGVTDIAVGQRVGWLSDSQGSFADATVIAADKTVPLPDDIDDETALALLMQGITSHYLATDTYPVKPGDIALVHAAAGGVGLLLTQIIKRRGGIVIGTVSSDAKAHVARAAGADHVIPYDGFAEAVQALTNGKGVQVVYDGVGAATAGGSLAALGVRGTLVFFGNASGPVPPLDVLRLTSAGSVYVTRPTVAHYARTAEERRARANDLFNWVTDSSIRVSPPTPYAFTELAAAFAALESRQSTGKLILKL